MVAPIVIGKRKKDSQLASEAKTKKENQENGCGKKAIKKFIQKVD